MQASTVRIVLSVDVSPHADCRPCAECLSKDFNGCRLPHILSATPLAQMWRGAFQSVADDVDRISEEVGKRVAQDPLAAIGMHRPEMPRLSADSGRSSKPSKGGNESLETKRRRKAGEEKGGTTAKEAAMADPFARRRTRPKSYWANATEGGSLKDVSPQSLCSVFGCRMWQHVMRAILIYWFASGMLSRPPCPGCIAGIVKVRT